MASPLVKANTQVLLVALEDVLERLLSQIVLGDTFKATYPSIILFIVDPLTIDYEIEANKLSVLNFVINQPKFDVEVFSIIVLDSTA